MAKASPQEITRAKDRVERAKEAVANARSDAARKAAQSELDTAKYNLGRVLGHTRLI